MASISSYHDVLIRPLITEKSTRMIEIGQYTFEVHREANKIQIREAVEKTFNVKVKAVNTLNMPRKDPAAWPDGRHRARLEESDRHAPGQARRSISSRRRDGDDR